MSSGSPRVTIGIATFNRRALLEKSLRSALTQTYTNLQIVISDDGSADDTWAFLGGVTDPRVRSLRSEHNLGLVANYNRCLDAAEGEFFLMLNDDDTLEPTAIEDLLHAFLHPARGLSSDDVGVAWAPFRNVTPEGEALWTVRGGPVLETTADLLEGLFTGTRGPLCSGILIRTEDARDAGGYEARFGALCDSALWGKACLRRPYATCVDRPLWNYLVHTSTGSATSEAQCAFWQDAIRAEIVDFVEILRARGDHRGATRLLRAGHKTLANVTVTVLLRTVGKPGWIGNFLQECWRSRSFMFTPFVGKRVLKDGWKMIRLVGAAG